MQDIVHATMVASCSPAHKHCKLVLVTSPVLLFMCMESLSSLPGKMSLCMRQGEPIVESDIFGSSLLRQLF